MGGGTKRKRQRSRGSLSLSDKKKGTAKTAAAKPVAVADGEAFWEVEAVKDFRTVVRPGGGGGRSNPTEEIEFLVQWKGPYEDTWEPEDCLSDTALQEALALIEERAAQKLGLQNGSGNSREAAFFDVDCVNSSCQPQTCSEQMMDIDDEDATSNEDEAILSGTPSIDNEGIPADEQHDSSKGKEKRSASQQPLVSVDDTLFEWNDASYIVKHPIERIDVSDPTCPMRVTNARLAGIPVVITGHVGWAQFAQRWLRPKDEAPPDGKPRTHGNSNSSTSSVTVSTQNSSHPHNESSGQPCSNEREEVTVGATGPFTEVFTIELEAQNLGQSALQTTTSSDMDTMADESLRDNAASFNPIPQLDIEVTSTVDILTQPPQDEIDDQSRAIPGTIEATLNGATASSWTGRGTILTGHNIAECPGSKLMPISSCVETTNSAETERAVFTSVAAKNIGDAECTEETPTLEEANHCVNHFEGDTASTTMPENGDRERTIIPPECDVARSERGEVIAMATRLVTDAFSIELETQQLGQPELTMADKSLTNETTSSGIVPQLDIEVANTADILTQAPQDDIVVEDNQSRAIPDTIEATLNGATSSWTGREAILAGVPLDGADCPGTTSMSTSTCAESSDKAVINIAESDSVVFASVATEKIGDTECTEEASTLEDANHCVNRLESDATSATIPANGNRERIVPCECDDADTQPEIDGNETVEAHAEGNRIITGIEVPIQEEILECSNTPAIMDPIRSKDSHSGQPMEFNLASCNNYDASGSSMIHCEQGASVVDARNAAEASKGNEWESTEGHRGVIVSDSVSHVSEATDPQSSKLNDVGTIGYTLGEGLLDLAKPHYVDVERMSADIGEELVPILRKRYDESQPIKEYLTIRRFLRDCWPSTTDEGTLDTNEQGGTQNEKAGGKKPHRSTLYLHQWLFTASETAVPKLCGEGQHVPLPNNILGDDLLKYWYNKERCNGESPYQYLFMGNTGTMSKLHKDSGGLMISIAPIVGKKEVVLVHRDDGQTSLYDLEANLDKPDLFRYPMMYSARVWKSVIEPGEILIMPQGTYHQCRNVTPCLSYHRFHLDTVNLKAFIESRDEKDSLGNQQEIIWNAVTELHDKIGKFVDNLRLQDERPAEVPDEVYSAVVSLRTLHKISRAIALQLEAMGDHDTTEEWNKLVADAESTLHDFRYRRRRCIPPFRPCHERRDVKWKFVEPPSTTANTSDSVIRNI